MHHKSNLLSKVIAILLVIFLTFGNVAQASAVFSGARSTRVEKIEHVAENKQGEEETPVEEAKGEASAALPGQEAVEEEPADLPEQEAVQKAVQQTKAEDEADASSVVLSPEDAEAKAPENNQPMAIIPVSPGDSIQTAINNAAAGDTIQIAAGTYTEQITITKELILEGLDRDTVIIDASTFSGNGVLFNGDFASTIKNLTVKGPQQGSSGGYGIKVQGDNATTTISNVLVEESRRTGIDLNGLNSATLSDLILRNNGGNGLTLTDTSNVTLTNSNTSGNAWGGVAIYTKHNAYTPGADNISIDPSNVLAEGIGLYTETDPAYPVTNLNAPDYPYMLSNTAESSHAKKVFYTKDLVIIPQIIQTLFTTHPEKSVVREVATGHLVVYPNSSIQTAIDNAISGDIISVQAGTYVENVVVNKSLTLAGEDKETVILYPAEAGISCDSGSICAGSSNVILIEASGVTIHGLTVDGDNPDITNDQDGANVNGANIEARNGIITKHGTGVNFSGLTVYDTIVKNIYGRGIYMSTNGEFDIHDNTVTNVAGASDSVALFSWGSKGKFANNTVSLAKDAISSNHSKGIEFIGNTITNSGSGIHTDNSLPGAGKFDLIKDNTITCDGTGYGIFTFATHQSPYVENNTVTGCKVGLSAWGSRSSDPIVFSGNTVDGTGATDSIGLYVTTSIMSHGYLDINVAANNNTFINNKTAVKVSADDMELGATFVAKDAKVTLYQNNMDSTNTLAVDASSETPVSVEASGNWWGTADGPAGRYTGPVRYCGHYDGSLPGANLIYDGAVTNTRSTETHCSIQEAVDAAQAGDALNISAGTFAEQVVIDKALTLQGPNADKFGFAEDRVDEAVVTYPDGLDATVTNQAVFLIESDNVTIKGLKVQTKEYMEASQNALILTASANNLKIENNIVLGSQIGIYRSPYMGASFTGENTGWLVTGNLVDGLTQVNSKYGRGIYIYKAEAEVSNNLIRNTNVGIQILPATLSGTGIVKDNVIYAGMQGLYHNGHDKGAGAWTYQGNTVRMAPNDRSAQNVHGPYGSGDVQLNFRAIEIRNFGSGGTGETPKVYFIENDIDTNYASPKPPHIGGRIGAFMQGTIAADAVFEYHNNSFVGYGYKSAVRFAGINPVGKAEASANWWGTANGPAGQVTGPVHYCGWLDAPYPTGELIGNAVKNTTTGTAYCSFKEAVAGATAGDTLQLLGDVVEPTDVIITKNLTIDTNGKVLSSITSNEGFKFIRVKDSAEVTITGNGLIKTSGVEDPNDENAEKIGYGVRVEGGAKVTLDGATLYGGYFAVEVVGDNTADQISEFTMNSGTVNRGIFVRQKGATVIINDGTINRAGGLFATIQGHGIADQSGTTITINGGTLNSEGNIGIYHPQDGVLNIHGGVIKGHDGIEMKAGTLNMTGGTVNANGPLQDELPSTGNGSTETGDAIYVAVIDAYPGNININITGGTLISENNYSVRVKSFGDESELKSLVVHNTNVNNKISNSTSVMLDASANWWGTADGPEGQYTGLVKYCGYYDGPIPGGNLVYGSRVKNETTSALYCSIQEAVDTATAGDTLTLEAGTFAEQVVINKALTLQGPNADKLGFAEDRVEEAVITYPEDIVWEHSDELANLVKVAADGVTIKGIKMVETPLARSHHSSLIFTWSANDLVVQNNVLLGTTIPVYRSAADPVKLDNNGWLIEGNLIDGLTNVNSRYGRGVYIWKTRADVVNNRIVNTNVGVQILPNGLNGGGTVKENVIMAGSQGLYHNNAYKGAGDWSFVGNTISMALNTREAQDVYGPYNDTHSKVLFRLIDIINLGGSGTGVTPKVSFLQNNFDGSTVANSENHVEKSVGIYLRGTVAADASITIHENAFVNIEAENGLLRVGTNAVANVDASGNWWGSNDYATVKGLFSDPLINSIDITPWLDSGEDADTVKAGFQATKSHYHVVEEGLQLGEKTRIQEAIDMISGSTVTVHAGTYAGGFTVNKALKLEGPNKGIDPVNGTRVEEAILEGDAVMTIDAAGVVVDGFTFDKTQLNALQASTVKNNIFTKPSDKSHAIALGLEAGGGADPLNAAYTFEQNQFTDTAPEYLKIFLPTAATEAQTTAMNAIFQKVVDPAAVAMHVADSANPYGYVAALVPVGTPDEYTVEWSEMLDVLEQDGVLANDSDPNNLPLTATLVPNSGPTMGTLVLRPNGSFTYSHAGGAYTTPDSFQYTVSNGVLTSDPITVTINVTYGVGFKTGGAVYIARALSGGRTQLGVSSDFSLEGMTVLDAQSIVVKLYGGTEDAPILLQTNTAKLDSAGFAGNGTGFTSPFEIFGTYSSSSWTNLREAEFGQTEPATHVVATVTMPNGHTFSRTAMITNSRNIIIRGNIAAQDFGYAAINGVLGVSAGFEITEMGNLIGAQSLVVKLYSGEESDLQLLQTNTAILEGGLFDAFQQFSTPFDIFGDFDYVADGYWTNVRESEYGQTVEPTCVEATVTFLNGTTKSARNCILTGDRDSIILGELTITDFYYAYNGPMKGVSADMKLTDATSDDAVSIVVELFTGEGEEGAYQPLQTNTANLEKFNAASIFTSPFDIYGTRNYVGSSWANMRETEYGQHVIPTRVLATVTLKNGKVLTAERLILTGDRDQIVPSVVAEDFTYGAWSGIKGVNAGFHTVNFDLGQAVDVKVELFSGADGDVLMQTDTWIKENTAWAGMQQYSAPFDIFGTFDYVADGYWTNARETEYGQTAIPTRVLTTITLPGDVVVTAENTNLTGDRRWIVSTLDEEIRTAKEYEYTPPYVYVGDITFDDAENLYHGTYTPKQFFDKRATFDLARYLGALHRQATSTVQKITFEGVEYTWQEVDPVLKGSNWRKIDDSSITLVRVVSDMVIAGEIKENEIFSIVLSDGYNTETVRFKFTVTNTLDTEIGSGFDYEYNPAYTYVGTREFDDANNVYTVTYKETEIAPHAMNDLARYLGALHRQEDATVIQISYNGVNYTWDAEGTLAGSNWKDADGNTLVSVVVAAFYSGTLDPDAGLTLVLSDGVHTENVTFKMVINDTTAPLVQTITAIGATGFDNVEAVERTLTVDRYYQVATVSIVFNEDVTVEDGTVVSKGGVAWGTIACAEKTCTVTPNEGNEIAQTAGDYSFSLPAGSIKDSAGNALTDGTLTLVVREVVPTAKADSYAMASTTTLDVSAAEGVLANDTDPQNKPLTAVLVEGPATGTLTLNEDGSFSYVEGPEFVNEVSFTYKATNGTYESEVVTVTISISYNVSFKDGTASYAVQNASGGRTMIGVTSKFSVLNMVLKDAESFVVRLYGGTEDEPILLQTNTAKLDGGGFSPVAAEATSPFNIFGTYSPSSWTNVREAEYGQTVPATHAVATIVMPNGYTFSRTAMITNERDIIIRGDIAAQDFGYMNASGVKGVSAGFEITDMGNLIGAQSLVVKLYTDVDGTETLLQTNTAILAGGQFESFTQFSSPFDIFGEFDYVEDGYWTNERETEFGETAIPSCAQATVTFLNGTTKTARNCNLMGDREMIVSTLDEEIASAPSYVYVPAYEYKGDMAFDDASNTYTMMYTPAEYLAGNAMHDLARYLGALKRQTGSTVKSIEYKGVTYTWDESLGNAGSNWANNGTSLVSVIVADLVGTLPGTATVTLADGYNTETVTFVVDVYNTIDDEITSAQNYEYTPPYNKVGEIVFDDENNTFVGTYNENVIHPGAMNDLARYLGGIYRQSNSTVIKIRYNDVNYTWQEIEPVLKGSNWRDADGTTLISVIVLDGREGGIDYTDAGLVLTLSDGIHTENVTFKVVITNVAPVAKADAYETDEDVTLTVAAEEGVLANDTDVSELTAVLVDEPAHGSVELAEDGSFVYVPNANFNGKDTFTYKAFDGEKYSEVATVTITITPVNDAPVAENQAVTTDEDTAVEITLAATDVDGDTLTYSIVGQPGHGTVELVGDVVTYTPALNYHGSDSFTFKANDGKVYSNNATVTITVTDIKDQVQAVDDFYTMDEDAVLTVAAPGVLENDKDVDNNVQKTFVTIPPSHGTVSMGQDGSFVYTPEANYNGTDTFEYILQTSPRTNDLWSDTATVTITINAINDAPVLEPIADATIPEMEAYTFTAVATDVDDGDTLTFRLEDAPTGATIDGTTGKFTWTPVESQVGEHEFQVCVTDGQLNDCTTVKVTLLSGYVNTPPVAVADAYEVAQNEVLTIVAPGVLANDSDADKDPLTAVLVGTTENGTLVLNADGSFTYTPNEGFVGNDSFTYKANDGKADSNVVIVTIKVTKSEPELPLGLYFPIILTNAN